MANMNTKLPVTRRRFMEAAGVSGIVGLAGCAGGGDGGEGGDSGTTGTAGGEEGWVPSRNVRVIIPWGAGGGTDTMTRGVMEPAEPMMQEKYGIDVGFTFENITGANGLNAAQRVLNNPADGHILFPSTNSIAPHIATGQADFTLDDWGYVARIQHDTSWLYSSGREGVGWKDINKVVEAAKGGEQIQIGVVGGITGAGFAVLWANEAGILENTRMVTYQDAGRQRTEAISGEIDMSFGEIQEINEQYKSGDIALLLVGTRERLDEYPDVPSTGENGWDIYYGLNRGFNVKGGTPQKAIDFWTDVLKMGYESDRYQQLEQETLLYLREGWQGPDEFRESMEGAVEKYKKAVRLYEEATQ
ncbi:MAG: hypothetical protein ABEJ58_03955 [Halodesulfurarchaeum sp.]